MNYQEAKLVKEQRELMADIIAAKLKAFPKKPNGMVVDKTDPAFKQAKKEYDIAFKNLQDFNTYFMRTFKQEIKLERKQKSDDKLRPAQEK